jgi:hypothetical protein
LFVAEKVPDLGGSIEYVIVLNHEGPQLVSLRCMGKVLRADRLDVSPDGPQTNFQVAATLERYEFVRGRSAS